MHNILQLDTTDSKHGHMNNNGTVGALRIDDHGMVEDESNSITPHHHEGHLTQPESFTSQLTQPKQNEMTMQSNHKDNFNSQPQAVTSGDGFSNLEGLDTGHDETNATPHSLVSFEDPHLEDTLKHQPRSLEKEDNKKPPQRNNTPTTRSNYSRFADK